MPVSKHLAVLPKPGAYARGWKDLVRLAKSGLDCTVTARAFGYDFPVSPAELVLAWRKALQNRINVRGGMMIRDLSDDRLHRKRAIHLRYACKFCGIDVGYRRWEYQRFCSAQCRHSYYC